MASSSNRKAFELAFKNGENEYLAFGMDESVLRVYERRQSGLKPTMITTLHCSKFMPDAEFSLGFTKVIQERTPRQIIERYGFAPDPRCGFAWDPRYGLGADPWLAFLVVTAKMWFEPDLNLQKHISDITGVSDEEMFRLHRAWERYEQTGSAEALRRLGYDHQERD